MSMLRRNSRKKKGKKGGRKRKTNKKIRVPYIPQNLMEEIFHKLPYNDMTRSKLVCKKWNSIISSPNFINDHYNRLCIEGNTHLIFMEYNEIEDKHNFRTLSHSDLVENRSSSINDTITSLEDIAKEQYEYYDQVRLIGSYNGLVAISYDHMLILWNPLTKKQSFVEVDVYDTHSHSDDYNNFHPRLLYGLCYDDTKDEYSVVVGSNYQSPPVSPTSFNEEVEYESTPVFVYYFKDGREEILHYSLNRRLLDGKLFDGEVGKVIRGVPHWVVQFCNWEDEFLKTDILYFDLREKVFKEMDRPSGCVEKKMLGLAAMNGENELGCVLEDVDTLCFEIWVMKEYGKVESWTNLYTFSYVNLSDKFGSIEYLNVMGFKPNNGESLIYLNDYVLLVCDVYTGLFREFKYKEGDEVETVITFEPKLISPPHPIQKSEDKNPKESNDDDDNGDDDSD